MNIRSIDLQVLIPQATEVGKTQHITNQQNALQQQDFASQWQKIAADRQQQVQNTPYPEGGKVKGQKEPQDKQRRQHAKERNTGKETDHSAGTGALSAAQGCEDPVRGQLIDIKT